MLQAGKLRVRIPIRSLDFFNCSNPSSALLPWGRLTEMSISNLRRGNGREARKADNLSPICESIV
jgi:hypothetical protein